MNRLVRTVGILLVCVLWPWTGWCADKVSFLLSGQDKGSAQALVQNGTTYVDVQKAARKFGAGVTLFARSKQAKVTARGFYAIFTDNSPEVVINARIVTLDGPVLTRAGTVLVPVSFFLRPEFTRAVGKNISFSQNQFVVERPFDVERLEQELTAQEDRLVFRASKPVTWKAQAPNAHTVEVVFPQAVIKRDEFFRLKTDFVSSVSIHQSGEQAQVQVILGKNGRVWKVEENGGKIFLRVGKNELGPLPAAKAPAAPQQSQTVAPVKEAAAEIPPPSVLAQSDDSEAIPLTAAAAKTVMKTETPTMKAAQPQPVVKPAPVPVVSAAHKKMRIVVDPGHGGKDPGAVRSRVREKDLNLGVSKELFKLLKKGGFEVKITRENDSFIPLSDRSKMSNTFKADLFVSVHTNASKNKQANGFQVYFRSEKASDKEAAETAALENEAMQYEEVHYNFVDALLQSLAKNEYINESSKLAGYVRNAVYKQPGIGIGVSQHDSVRQANFYVLKGVQSPAILVEMGFISSPKDRGRLTQSKVQKNMAQGIYNGIYNYAKAEGWIK
ncbi:MAG: N-acetylmuramoyl-L-alanine amidase [Elusimicrobiaceae bacterium]|nr:N-acetylmuramoyl-L-alanine amidase [Elusimicrobiaceae bacterium]